MQAVVLQVMFVLLVDLMYTKEELKCVLIRPGVLYVLPVDGIDKQQLLFVKKLEIILVF